MIGGPKQGLIKHSRDHVSPILLFPERENDGRLGFRKRFLKHLKKIPFVSHGSSLKQASKSLNIDSNKAFQKPNRSLAYSTERFIACETWRKRLDGLSKGALLLEHSKVSIGPSFFFLGGGTLFNTIVQSNPFNKASKKGSFKT